MTDETGKPLYLVTGAEWGHKCQFPTCSPGQSCQSIAMITEIVHARLERSRLTKKGGEMDAAEEGT